MKKLAFAIVLLLTTPSTIFAHASLSNFYDQVDEFLKRYVKKGRVDYQQIKSNFEEVDAIYQSLSGYTLDGLDAAEIQAFYINAYNIIVIRQIAKLYPVRSALDQNGFFNKVKHKVAGEMLTLDQIEKGKVILKYNDARVHFAFSCAANSCPELADFAYRPEKLDGQLDERTRKALNDPDFTKVDQGNESVQLSMLFKWYLKDFEQNGMSSLDFVNRYRKDKIPASYKLNFYEYDWGLNVME